MNRIAEGTVTLCYSADILQEYERVLAYERLGFSAEIQKAAIDDIKNIGESVVPTVSSIAFADESDRVFYDTAKEAEAYLITYNLKHYPSEQHIIEPAQFLTIIKK